MDQSTVPVLPCLCANLRRAARALTQLYEHELRPLGLRSTQLTILQALFRTGELSQGQLGQILAMDTTSLTRTLAIMARQGWIAERRGQDRRERQIRLSDAGEKQLKRVLPAWEKVQARVRHQLGGQSWNSLMQLSRQLAGFTTIEGELR